MWNIPRPKNLELKRLETVAIVQYNTFNKQYAMSYSFRQCHRDGIEPLNQTIIAFTSVKLQKNILQDVPRGANMQFRSWYARLKYYIFATHLIAVCLLSFGGHRKSPSLQPESSPSTMDESFFKTFLYSFVIFLRHSVVYYLYASTFTCVIISTAFHYVNHPSRTQVYWTISALRNQKLSCSVYVI